MIILVDMDGVISDFDGHAKRLVAERLPDAPIADPDLKFFPVNYPEFEDPIAEICYSEGFFLEMPVVPGAVEGLKAMLELGHNVKICTSQLSKNNFCLLEKYLWVQKFVPFMKQRLIITKDKTFVRGDILIDDKPRVTGALQPEWIHVLYDRPYNRSQDGLRMTWENLDELLESIAGS